MAKKYIVGDWVKFLFEESKVIEVYNDGSYSIDSPNVTGCPKEEELSPIPLTPEILEKNGWYGATHSKQSDDNTKILYKTFKRKGYPTIKVSQDLKITCELSPFIVKLESVSDLQHLLFGLGLNSEMEV